MFVLSGSGEYGVDLAAPYLLRRPVKSKSKSLDMHSTIMINAHITYRKLFSPELLWPS